MPVRQEAASLGADPHPCADRAQAAVVSRSKASRISRTPRSMGHWWRVNAFDLAACRVKSRSLRLAASLAHPAGQGVERLEGRHAGKLPLSSSWMGLLPSAFIINNAPLRVKAIRVFGVHAGKRSSWLLFVSWLSPEPSACIT